LKSPFIPERGKGLFQKEDIMKIKNVSSVWGYLTFFSVVMAMVLVLSGSIVFAQKLIDLNGASQKELESIKGVGPATAKKIVAGRPYKSVDDLSKAGLSTKQVETIKPFVTVGSATSAPAEPPKATAKPATPPETPKAAKPTVGKAPEEAATPPAKGMVWVNLKSKVYHVEGDRYYGKTKSGEWMTEDEAIKKGYHKSKQETKTKK
jgi:hypothetical protein